MNASVRAEAAGIAPTEFSPVDNELPLRWFRRLHLVPPNGIGAGRRAMFLALLTWLPIAAWAAVAGRLTSSNQARPPGIPTQVG